jgi:hypothetical protein
MSAARNIVFCELLNCKPLADAGDFEKVEAALEVTDLILSIENS